MGKTVTFAAVDLGAESGRVMLAAFDGARVVLTEVARFPNVPVRVAGSLHWDVLRLFGDIQNGLAAAGRQSSGALAAIGVDTWGVDFALLDRRDGLLGNPVHHRDERTSGILDQVFARVPREEVFALTGIQFMEINTLCQLFAMVRRDSPLLEAAATFLTIPDLMNFWLTGRKACEFTNATTTQCHDATRGDWCRGLLERLGVPTDMLPAIVQPGTVLGPLLGDVATAAGLAGVPVVAPACHDTGSAVVAVPSEHDDCAWISSGTWSVLGAEVPQPVISPDSLAFNFTNEGGVAGKYRLCKNIMGLWLLQECRRTWARGVGELSYADLLAEAGQEHPLVSLVDPDHPSFLRPGDMPLRITEVCTQSEQPRPETRGAIVQCILESLAMKYRFQLERLERMLGRRVSTIHIVGGGSRNELLCQYTANVTARPVVAGPVEATALGNAMMQAIGLGHIASLAEARQIVAASSSLKTYEPSDWQVWEDAYGRFEALLQGG